MEGVAALAVALPLLSATVLAAARPFVPARVSDVLAVAAAAATTALCSVLLVDTADERVVTWFGGWEPRDGVAIGIDFAVDRFGAAIALLAAVLVTASLVYSLPYFEEGGTLYPTLVLLFLGGMVGFALTGDLFNWFVFFELMGVAAFALTAYQVEETGPIQGAFNFAVTNSIAGFTILFGLGLLYGQTGALNLAQLGRAFDRQQPTGLVVAGFTLIAVGFLVKSAAVPFHFWLADAHAVAPAPICVLFSGVMVELGVYAFARLHWTVFEGAFSAHAEELRVLIVTLGAITALVGGVMCFLQRHIKRLLAYSTISHVGVFVVGVGLLSGDGLAGVALYVVAHGLLKGGLFLLVGVLLNRVGSVDELDLHGRGRALPVTGVLFAAAGLALASPPLVGTFAGKSVLEHAAASASYAWVAALMLVASALTAGAVLRVAGRVFLGLGAAEDPLLSPQPEETEPLEEEPRRAPLLVGVAAALVIGGVGVSLAPGLVDGAKLAAEQFRDHQGYTEEVLAGESARSYFVLPHETKLSSVALGVLSVAAAIGVAAFGLRAPRLPRLVVAPLDRLRAAHSGAIGDYVAWLTFGAALFGGGVALVVA